MFSIQIWPSLKGSILFDTNFVHSYIFVERKSNLEMCHRSIFFFSHYHIKVNKCQKKNPLCQGQHLKYSYRNHPWFSLSFANIKISINRVKTGFVISFFLVPRPSPIGKKSTKIKQLIGECRGTKFTRAYTYFSYNLGLTNYQLSIWRLWFCLSTIVSMRVGSTECGTHSDITYQQRISFNDTVVTRKSLDLSFSHQMILITLYSVAQQNCILRWIPFTKKDCLPQTVFNENILTLLTFQYT